MEWTRHPLILKLLSLQLPPTDYVIAGSGPLLAHGLRQELGDLDVVARGTAWKIALSTGDPGVAPSGYGNVILLFEGSIEIFDRWLPGTSATDRLIEQAELVEGLPFCPLREVLAWKQRSHREKDQEDISLIERYLHEAG